MYVFNPYTDLSKKNVNTCKQFCIYFTNLKKCKRICRLHVNFFVQLKKTINI